MNKIKSKKPVKTVKPKAKAKVAAPVKAEKAKPVVAEKPAKAPKAAAKAAPVEEIQEPKKLKLTKEEGAKYKRLLLELRDHLIDGVSFLANENLKRSARDASGELSGYSLHMADAGTDNFDREFALSLVSNDQEGLYEVEEALKRLEAGTYGICEMCEKPVRKERLEAVPFARLCVQCQSGIEKDRRRPMQTTAVFTENADDEGGESDDSEE